MGNWKLIEGAVVLPIDQSAIDERRDDLRAFEEFLELSNITHESKLAYIYIASAFTEYIISVGRYHLEDLTKATAIDFAKYSKEGISLYTERNYLYISKYYIKFILERHGRSSFYEDKVKGSFILSSIMPQIYPDIAIEKLRALTPSTITIIDKRISNDSSQRMRLRNYIALNLLIETGMTSSELIKLKVHDLRIGKGDNVYKIITSKDASKAIDGQKDKKIYRTIKRTIIEKELKRYLSLLPNNQENDILLLSKNYKPLTRKALSNIIKHICIDAGIRYINVKAFRHTYARRKILIDKVQPSTLKELLGYRNMKSVMLYYAIYGKSIKKDRPIQQKQLFDEVAS